MVIVMSDPTKRTLRKFVCWHVNALYLLFALYEGLMMDWFKPKHVAQAYKREYKSCFDCWFILFFVSFKKKKVRCIIIVGKEKFSVNYKLFFLNRNSPKLRRTIPTSFHKIASRNRACSEDASGQGQVSVLEAVSTR